MAWERLADEIAEEFDKLTGEDRLQDALMAWAAERRQRDIARKKEAREKARIRRLRYEERTCPVCKRKFRVLLGDKPGRNDAKVYDTERCRLRAEKRRQRARKRCPGERRAPRHIESNCAQGAESRARDGASQDQ
jgi:hypothetical protein